MAWSTQHNNHHKQGGISQLTLEKKKKLKTPEC